MSHWRRNSILVAVAAVVLMGIGVAAFLWRRNQQPYDPRFDARIAEPAYRHSGPVVLYDEAHLNTHTADGAYKPLADLIRSDGYQLRISRQPLSPQVLEGVSVLVSVLPRGPNDANDDPAFTDSEIAAVDHWVRQGGALLLVTDHWPYGPAAAPLAQRFGIEMGKGLVEDPEYHEPARGGSHLVFSADNGLLRDHVIIRGRNSAERVQRVLTFTGQSLVGPSPATPFLALSDTAIEYPPSIPKVEKQGGDVRVSMEYGTPVPARGRAQGIAFELEKGRIVILGDAGMLRATRGSPQERVGMNVPGYDNRQLAINILRWLSRVL